MDLIDLEAEKKKIRKTMNYLTIDTTTNIEEASKFLSKDIFLMPPNSLPITGLETARAKLIEDKKIPIYSIGGEPLNMEISKNADIAWEYGSYYIQYSKESGDSIHGYYLSIFRKEDGVWKLIGHSWNEIK